MKQTSAYQGSLPISSQFRRNLATRCSLLFGGGLAVTAALLYLTLARPTGGSYGESFRMLSSTRQQLLSLSLGIYLVVFLLIIAGIAILTLLYSHRIVGPLYRLGVITRTIKNGDLRQKAVLRKNDMVTPLADELNNFSTCYAEKIRQIQKKTGDLKRLSSQLETCEDQTRRAALQAEIASTAGEVKQLLDTVTL